MFKKLILLSLVCISTAQADWKTDTSSKLANSFVFVGVFSACSYAMYKLLSTVVDKLESDKKISPKAAVNLKNILKARALIIPATMVYNCYKNPMPLHDVMQTVLDACMINSSIIAPEITLWEILKKFLNF